MDGIETIRNIGIIAHIDAGKTTTTEGMLYYSGLTHRYGKIDDGTTVMDFLPEERERGITILAAAATIPWKERTIHLIDTPGHIDFTAEVERSLRVIDGAVVIFSAVEGVEAQSEKVWRQADKYHVPKIAFINKLDRVGASFPRVIEEINAKFGECAVPVQLPVGIEDGFRSMVDLITMQHIRFEGEDNRTVVREELREDLVELAVQGRERLIERLADESDDIALLYLEGEEIPEALIVREIRRLTIARTIVPVLCGSGKMNLGIQPLMDAVLDFLPSPLDLPDVPAHSLKDDSTKLIHPDPKAAFSGLIFKVSASMTADLFYMRTYSGTLDANATVINARTREKVRAKQLFKIYAKSTEQLTSVGPGDIVGIVGLKNCSIGDTLCDTHRMVSFEKIVFPEPVISVAIEPRYSKDKDRLDEVLGLLCREDQTLTKAQDEETGQRILSGMGELHLEIKLKRVAQDFNVEVRTGEPRVAYRETLSAPTVENVDFDRVIGETEWYAGVRVSFKPLPKGEEIFTIENRVRDRARIPKDFMHAAERALKEGLRTGGSHGYPLIYLSAAIEELRFHPEKTTDGAVVGAVLQAIDAAITRVGTTVLEPLMHLEVLAPDESVGEITMYLHPRRAVIHEMIPTGGVRKISCEVPLAEMFGFGKALPRLTGGRGSFSMEPCGYQILPPDYARKLFGAY